MKTTRLAAACAGVMASLWAVNGSADPAPKPAKGMGETVMPASDEGQRALERFKLAPGLKVSLFAAEPDLANPVALNTDEQGRWYVVESFRRRQGTFDIRGIMSWLDEDLACRTVEDRLAMMRRHLGAQYATLDRLTERVRLIEDRDGDGKADHSQVFAEGFNTPADGIAAGVVARRGSVYFTCIPNLWLLKDTNGDGKADVKQSLQYGYGIRIGFGGHDSHGPRFGPDGKLYLSVGDRGVNVKTEHGEVSVLESGAVLRCNPDGTGLEVFATGLRNPQSLCFDDYGNLFTGDNNCDHGDPARWVYVVEGADNGWRVGYQHLPNAGPWNAEKIHALPDRNDCASIVPPVAHLGAGPSGVAHYPGTGLSERYRDHFWMVDFRGGATNSGIHSFTMTPKGAGFEMHDRSQFIWNVLATDCVFGVDGGLYLCDWVNGWDTTGKGRIYRVYDEQAAASPLVAETRRLIAEGMEKRPPEELIKLLAHADQRVRQEAQFELAGRGDASIPLLDHLARAAGATIPRLHAIWGLGQIGTPQATGAIASLLADSDPEVRAQAAKVAGERRLASAADALIARLDDATPRVAFFSAIALGKLHTPAATPALASLLRRTDNRDPWLRHAAVMGLAGTTTPQNLARLASDPSPAVRMGALLALRRLHDPHAADFLADADPWVKLEAARAINDTPITEAQPKLAQLASAPGLDPRVMRRVINANYRVGGPDEAKALAQIAARTDLSDELRVEALADLSTWENPSGRDRVVGLWRPVTTPRDPAAPRAAVTPHIEHLGSDKSPAIRAALAKLMGKLGGNPELLAQLATRKGEAPDVRAAALEAMAAQHHPQLDSAVRSAMLDPQPAVRKAAIALMGKNPSALKTLEELLGNGSIADQQAIYAAITGIDAPLVDRILISALDRLAAGTLPRELALDVLEAARKARTQTVKQKLAAWESRRPRGDDLAGLRETLYGGDAAAGRRIFFERQDAQCTRCHLAGNRNESGQPMAGPELTGIGSRKDRAYFLESILLPNKQVAAGYEGIQVKLKTGRGVAGILKAEDDKTLSIDIPDKGIAKVNKADVLSRERGPSAMPEGFGQILSKRDLRDLVEFLASLKAPPTSP